MGNNYKYLHTFICSPFQTFVLVNGTVIRRATWGEGEGPLATG
jgi:hypothetical protein